MNSQVLSPRVQMPEGSSLGWKLSSRKWRNSLWGWGLSGQIWTRKASGVVLVGKWLTWVISSGNALIGDFLAWVAGRAEERGSEDDVDEDPSGQGGQGQPVVEPAFCPEEEEESEQSGEEIPGHSGEAAEEIIIDIVKDEPGRNQEALEVVLRGHGPAQAVKGQVVLIQGETADERLSFTALIVPVRGGRVICSEKDPDCQAGDEEEAQRLGAFFFVQGIEDERG